MPYLVLVRHGESKWNKKGLWTGWTDIDLDEEGRQKSRDAGHSVTDISFQIAFTSKLKRAKETLREMKTQLRNQDFEIVENSALNERDYGDLTGKNKWEIRKKVGVKTFLKIRRSWDFPVPGGESLKDVYDRVVPYYQKEIEPHLFWGDNVLIVAHGNSLRALVKYLEGISDRNIPQLEIATGEVDVYQLDDKGKIIGKEVKNTSLGWRLELLIREAGQFLKHLH
ncbi:MAG: 2,3-bisphosphoglycerate-dependent phosphoglycerate mutase [Armatimonadetes bacterium]|nr:MAG: 2,3-bisphosphoglycerate-dependent phosphoglycerate mutase [Armatimonadota bacterium]